MIENKGKKGIEITNLNSDAEVSEVEAWLNVNLPHAIVRRLEEVLTSDEEAGDVEMTLETFYRLRAQAQERIESGKIPLADGVKISGALNAIRQLEGWLRPEGFAQKSLQSLIRTDIVKVLLLAVSNRDAANKLQRVMSNIPDRFQYWKQYRFAVKAVGFYLDEQGTLRWREYQPPQPEESEFEQRMKQVETELAGQLSGVATNIEITKKVEAERVYYQISMIARGDKSRALHQEVVDPLTTLLQQAGIPALPVVYTRGVRIVGEPNSPGRHLFQVRIYDLESELKKSQVITLGDIIEALVKTGNEQGQQTRIINALTSESLICFNTFNPSADEQLRGLLAPFATEKLAEIFSKTGQITEQDVFLTLGDLDNAKRLSRVSLAIVFQLLFSTAP